MPRPNKTSPKYNFFATVKSDGVKIIYKTAFIVTGENAVLELNAEDETLVFKVDNTIEVVKPLITSRKGGEKKFSTDLLITLEEGVMSFVNSGRKIAVTDETTLRDLMS